MRTVLLISFFWLLTPAISAQDIKSDTTIAGQYLSRAKSLIYNRQFNKQDSILFYSQFSAKVFKQYNNIERHLESLSLEMQIFARRSNEKQSKLLFDSISDLGRINVGEKNVYLADALHSMGVVNQNLQKYDPAIEYFIRSAEMRKAIFGNKNLELAQTYMNLGIVSESRQDYVKAFEYYNNSLIIRKELLGEKDFNVAQTLYNIGNNYRLRRDPVKAMEFLEKSLAIRRELFGEISADVASCYNMIGLVYELKREYEKALEYYSKALEVRLALPGEPNSDLAQSYNNVAVISSMKGDYDKALDYQIKSMEIKKKLYGLENIRIAESYMIIGSIFRSKNDFSAALEYTLKSLDLRLKILGTKHVDVAKVYGNLGLIYFDISEYDKALDNQLKSLEIFRDLLGEEHINLATPYNIIGSVYNMLSEFDKALEYYNKALKLRILAYGERSLEVADSYYNIGNIYNRKSDFTRDLEFNIKALNIYQKLMGENSLKVADSYNNIGMLYVNLSKIDDALGYMEKSLEIKRSILGERNTSIANSYSNLGTIYNLKSEYDKALKNYQKSLEIRKSLLDENSIEVAQSYNNMGVIYQNLSEYNRALEFFNMSLEVELKLFGEQHIDVANTYANMGSAYGLKGEGDKGLEFFLKALDIRKNLLGEKNVELSLSYNSIGAAYSNKGESEKALSYFSKALEINRELIGEQSIEVAHIYKNMGLVYASLSDAEKYLEYVLKAEKIYAAVLGENSSHISMIYSNIGVYYADKDKHDKALEYHLRALRIMKGLYSNKNFDLALSYSHIANIYGKNGDYLKALENYQKGLCSNIRGFNDTMNVAIIPEIDDFIDYVLLLEALLQKGQMFENMADSSVRIELPGINNLTRRDLYKLSLQNYILCDKVIDETRKKISLLSDKMVLSDNASEIYEAAIRVSVKLHNQENKKGTSSYLDHAFNFSEKNKSMVLLEAMAGQEGLKFAGIPDSLLEREHILKVNIAFFEKQLAQPKGKTEESNFRNLLFAAQREYETLTLMFEKKFPNYFSLKYSNTPPSIKAIQGFLDEKTAIRSYFEGDYEIYIFTLTRNRLYVSHSQIAENLQDSIIWYRYGLTNTAPRMQNAYKRLGYLLYQYLFPDSLSIPENITKLIIIPDGPMATIPFESLLTSSYSGPTDNYSDYPYLINKYDISYSYSANLLYKTFPKTASQPVEFTMMDDWLAFAPVFDDKDVKGDIITTRVLQDEIQKFKTDTIMVSRGMFHGEYITPLPATETEAEEILKLFDSKNLKGSILLHNSANEEFVKSGRLGNSRVLHFATHGFVNSERPELSGLLLAPDTTGGQDGVLYSGEIYNLKLNADLVLLSACETGLGKIQKGEGIIGLTRALLYAGAKNIIVSLWQVSDRSTSELMVDFYRNSLNSEKQSLSYSESLRKAKMLMIEQGKYSHPLYWSPFILIGK